MSQSVTQTVDYPLDPLSSEEFTRVAAILSREHQVGDGWRIASVEMIEPGKAELAAFDDGGPMPPRRAAVTCLQCANNATYKGVVSLTDVRVESFEHIPGVHANISSHSRNSSTVKLAGFTTSTSGTHRPHHLDADHGGAWSPPSACSSFVRLRPPEEVR